MRSDFVSVRHWETRDGVILSAGCAVLHPSMPPSKKHVRYGSRNVASASELICLERGADLHMAQQMPLPLTVYCFSKIQIGFTFLVPAYPGSPGKYKMGR